MKRRLLAVMGLLFMCLSPVSLFAQPDEAPPYLYYYSSLLGGLIIERADGTDSRHIAADVIPPNLTGISGPGWSPSGKYFAATGDYYGDYVGSNANVYLVDSQGHPPLDWLYRMEKVSSMRWSPTGEDLLLIIGNLDTKEVISEDYSKTFWLIDVEKGVLLTDFSADLGVLLYNMSEINWNISNKYVQFYMKNDAVYPFRYYRVTIHFDGTTLREPVAEEEFVPLNDKTDVSASTELEKGNAISQSGTYKVQGDDPTILTNFQTGEEVTLPSHTEGASCRNYIWSENEEYIVALTGTLDPGSECAAAVIGVTDREGKLWRELGGCSWERGACIGWLPNQVDLKLLPMGSSRPVQLDPRKIEYEENLWLTLPPAYQGVFRLVCEGDGSARVVHIESKETLFKLNNVDCPYQDIMTQDNSRGRSIKLAYDSIHGLLATFDTGWETGVLIWQRHDNGNGNFDRVYQLNSQGYALEFTEDGAFLRAGNFSGWKTFAVDDILERIEQSN